MDVVKIAKVCHEVNRAYCTAIGDNTQPEWKKAPAWQVESAEKGVKFHIKNPDAGPSASHDEWLKEKAETGWKYGIVKDVQKREHPCFLPYAELPVEQKAKDFIFTEIVKQLKDL